VTDILGKIWASPFTAVGSALGAANVGLAKVAGNDKAKISVGNNALQFENGLLGFGGRAFTMGNSVLYGPGEDATRPSKARYDGRGAKASLAEHEMGHTYQYQKYNFPALYLGNKIAGRITGRRNPYEDEADDFGDAVHGRRQR